MKVPRKMFQRRVESMSPSPMDLQQVCSFYLGPNTDLTVDLLEQFAKKPINVEIVNVSKHWYQRSPRRIQPRLPVDISDGGSVLAELAP